jgi:mono/diheme cytochrome c family protein
MKRFLRLSAFVALIASPVLLQDRAAGQTPAAAAADPNRAMLNTYCVGCHSARLKTGGLVLATLPVPRLLHRQQSLFFLDLNVRAVVGLRMG